MKKIVGNGRWRLAIGVVAIGVLAFGLSVYGLAPPPTHTGVVTPPTGPEGTAAKTATVDAPSSASLPPLELAAPASEGDVSAGQRAPVRGDQGGLRGGLRDITIWDNYPDGSGSWTLSSQVDFVYPFQSQKADDFLFDTGDDYLVRGLVWEGRYWNPGTPYNIVAFHVYIYPDDGTGNAPCLPVADPLDGGTPYGSDPYDPGNPGCSLEHYVIPIEDVTTTGLGGTDDFEYVAELPGGVEFVASDGVKYWIAIQSENTFQPQWGIYNVDPGQLHVAVGGFPLLGVDFWTDEEHGDTAFKLTGIPDYPGECGDGIQQDPEECDPGGPGDPPDPPPDDDMCPGECTEDCTCPPLGACCDDLLHFIDPPVACPDGLGTCAEGECAAWLPPAERLCYTGPVCYEEVTEKRCAEEYNGRWAGADDAGDPIPCADMLPACGLCDLGFLGPCGACCDEGDDQCYGDYSQNDCDLIFGGEYTFHVGMNCRYECEYTQPPYNCERMVAPCQGACCDEAGECDVESKAWCDALLPPGDFFNEGDCSTTGTPPDEVQYCECRDCDPDYTFLEGEPDCYDGYEDTFNGGCNSEPPAFGSSISCGDKVCGKVGTYREHVGWGGTFRDTDWYRLELEERTRITWTASGGYLAQVIVIDAGSEDCEDYTILDGITAAGECEEASVTLDLNAGVYWLFVAAALGEDTECGWTYNAELSCLSLDWLITNLTVTVHIDDYFLEGGYDGTIALSGETRVLRDPPPYTSGTDIAMEMIELDLTGEDPVLGPVSIVEREDMVSAGAVTDVVASGGDFVGGNSFFDVFHEVTVTLDEPPGEQDLFTVDPVHVEAYIEALPPIGYIYMMVGDPVDLWVRIFEGGGTGECMVQDSEGATQGSYSDVDCEPCGTGIQICAEDFVMATTEHIESIRFWGFDSGGEIDPDVFTVIFRDDDAGAPGAAIAGLSVSGVAADFQDGNEYRIDLDQYFSADFAPGTYWCEIYNDSTGSEASWAWLDGNLDPDLGRDGMAWTTTLPEEPWNLDSAANRSLELICSVGTYDDFVVGYIEAVSHTVKEVVGPCEIDCATAGYPLEGEPVCEDGYVDTYNGGCNSDPEVFQQIDCDDIICGEAGTFKENADGTGGDFRDMDWYALGLTQRTVVTWTVTAEFDVDIWILDGNSGCADPATIAFAQGTPDEPCTAAVATADICTPGTYWLVVAPTEFTGVPCGPQSEYIAQVTCELLDDPVCGDGVLECDEVCDPGDPPAIPPDDEACPDQCYPMGDPHECTCMVWRACCYGDPVTCGGDYLEDECVVGLSGVWHPNASCVGADGLPEPICAQDECSHDNGLPLDDLGAPASQYAPDSPFAAGAADDFILKGTGDNPCKITDITTWTTHWNGSTEGHPNPDDYVGINVTVYANMEPKAPGGEPFVDDPPDPQGSHQEYFPGGLVYTGFFDAFTSTDMAPTCGDDLWKIDINNIDDENFVLERNVKYWLEIQPVLNFEDAADPPPYGGQVAIALSQNSHGHNAMQIFPDAGLPSWTEIDGNADYCPPDTPPAGTRRDLAFHIIGEEIPMAQPVEARSYHLQGAYAGYLDMIPDNIEARACGIQTLEVDFSEDLTGGTVGASVECWDVAYAGAMTVDPPAGNMVVLHFDPQLPDQTCCRITFDTDASGSVDVRTLIGDLDRNNQVTSGDMDSVANQIGQALTGSNFTKDQDCNGSITSGDMDSIANKIGRTAADCP